MKNVTVAGGGVLGTQIAIQCAVKGKNVTIWLREESSIGRTKPKLDYFKEQYLQAVNSKVPAPGLVGVTAEDVNKAFDSLKIELDLQKAMDGCEILIEAISEDRTIKTNFFEKAKPFLSENTIVCTNSSTLVPSMFINGVPNPHNLLALHFANRVWENNLAEVMVQPETSHEAFEAVMEFARQIGMDPVAVLKEKSGYLLNSMLVPFLAAAMDLYATGTGTPQDIDEAWKKGTGAEIGPFKMLDIIGLKTVALINSQYVNVPDNLAPFHYKLIQKMLEDKIAKNEKFYN